jgi:hypothetical protein
MYDALIQNRKNNMDYLTIIAATLAAIGVIGLAWLGGYELGQANVAKPARRARPTVKELINQLNDKEPRGKRRTRK